MNKLLTANSRITTVCCVFTLGLALTAGVDNAAALSNNQSYKPSPANPSQSKPYGNSLTQWMMLYQTWHLQGQAPQTGTIGRVKLLPIPQQITANPPCSDIEQFTTGSLEMTLKTGSPFVLPVTFIVGESYVDNIVPPDQPNDFLKDSLLGADITVTLDKKPILESPADNEVAFFGPAYFPEPIVHNPPQLRYNDLELGDIYATAAIWSEGIGFVHPPLPVGKHTLHIYLVNRALKYGFDNTWNITVLP